MFRPLVRDQRTDHHHPRVHDWCKCFNDFLGTVALNVSLAFAEVAKASLSFSILLCFRFSSCGDRIHFVNLHRYWWRCCWWHLLQGWRILLHGWQSSLGCFVGSMGIQTCEDGLACPREFCPGIPVTGIIVMHALLKKFKW